MADYPQLATFEEGKRLAEALQNGEVPEHKRAAAEQALANLRERLESEEKAQTDNRQAEANRQRIQEVSQAVNTIADNPVGRAVPDPESLRGSPVGLGRMRPPSPDEDWVLHNQARDRGIDIHTGASFDQRLGQGLASLKDPQLRFNMLDSHYRKQLYEQGIDWPETVPVVMLEEQTGKLAYVRGIGEDDLLRGDKEENIGRTRLTLVDPLGLDTGDMAEWLPSISIAAGETGGAILAGLLKSPQAAAFGSATITAGIEAAASPIKDKLLRDYYGVTQEQLDQFSDPDEALNQAMLAGGLDLAMSQAMIFGRWLKNRSSKRTLTEDDYQALTSELDRMRKLNAEFKAATGETIEDPLMFVESASKRMETTTGQSIGATSMNFFKRLPEKWKRIWSTANDVTRLKLARGFRTVTNNATEEIGDLTRVGRTEDGLIVTRQDATEIGEEILKVAQDEYGVTAARRTASDTADEAERLMDELHDTVSSAHYKDIQDISLNDVAIVKQNEELQWAFFKDILEPNSTGSLYNISVVNGKNSPVRRALGRLRMEAADNYSKTLGDRTQGFVDDLNRLRGDNLDVMSMQRLRSDLLRAKRKVNNGTDTSGWTAKELDEIVDAIDDTLATQDWVRISTGRKVPAVRDQALNRLTMAREATDIMNNVARNSTIQDLVSQIKVYDMAAGRRFGERRRFEMQPAQVREVLFESGNAGPLKDVLQLSGHHPGMRAALADQLEAVYKQMALNPDGTFARGGYNRFMAEYGDHAEALFGPERAARITHADSMARAVEETNIIAKKVEDAYKNAFGDAVDPQKLGSQGVVRTIMSSSNVTSRQARTLMTRLRQIDPNLHQAVRGEFAQWAEGELFKLPVQMKNGNAIRQWLGSNQAKIRAVMGNQYFADMRTIQKMTDMVDLSELARGTAEPVQAQWLQLTRSVFGPLSRKQRFMTAANRIMRGRGAKKALELMADPQKLRRFVQLGQLDPTKVAFWSTAYALGLRGLMDEAGIVPPNDLETMSIREESMRNLAEGRIY